MGSVQSLSMARILADLFVPYCNCGKLIPSTDKFCRACGRRNLTFDTGKFGKIWGESFSEAYSEECLRLHPAGISQDLPYCALCGFRLFQ